MPGFVWIALAVFLGGFVAGALWLTVNAVRAWRRGWPAVRRLAAATGELAPKAAALETRVARLEPRLADLQRSTSSLAVSVSRARILLGVVLEAKHALDVARAFVPHR